MKVAVVCDLLSTFLRFRLSIALKIAELVHHVTVAVCCDEERLF
jgi:hypothetical protein